MRLSVGFVAAALGITILSLAAVMGARMRHDATMPPPALDVPTVAIPAPPVLKAEHFLALTMYHEARGQSPEAMRAVGWVVLNRTRAQGFPDGIRDVVVEPTRSGKCQFGWACGNFEEGLDRTSAWQQAQTVAAELLFRGGADPTKGAVWFWESWRERPQWLGNNVRQTLELGGHRFFAPSGLS
ncbi:cell wall hydrolase [Geminicoccus roseus]|uniref:cell wall hydrolase n=1 Tax=Geminicoccus roseus TaxID=404900 RepID=UPI0004133FD1|nr:cell wall hydrolase [Geminicoccus roseus]